MISLVEYLGKHAMEATQEQRKNADRLLHAVNALKTDLQALGLTFPYNPATRSNISGGGYGGYRPKGCLIGAKNSAHKEGLAIDIYDPGNLIDLYLFEHQDILEKHGIYIELPASTQGWSHWTIRAPGSGKRVFIP